MDHSGTVFGGARPCSGAGNASSRDEAVRSVASVSSGAGAASHEGHASSWLGTSIQKGSGTYYTGCLWRQGSLMSPCLTVVAIRAVRDGSSILLPAAAYILLLCRGSVRLARHSLGLHSCEYRLRAFKPTLPGVVCGPDVVAVPGFSLHRIIGVTRSCRPRWCLLVPCRPCSRRLFPPVHAVSGGGRAVARGAPR